MIVVVEKEHPFRSCETAEQKLLGFCTTIITTKIYSFLYEKLLTNQRFVVETILFRRSIVVLVSSKQEWIIVCRGIISTVMTGYIIISVSGIPIRYKQPCIHMSSSRLTSRYPLV